MTIASNWTYSALRLVALVELVSCVSSCALTSVLAVCANIAGCENLSLASFQMQPSLLGESAGHMHAALHFQEQVMVVKRA